MTRSITFSLALTAAISVFAASRTASADQVVVGTERAVVTTPNRSLLHSGVVTLGLSYVPAFIVAVESPVPADKNLFIPVAGPWLDLAQRDCPTCDHERLNKVLLVTDGIFQGIGALNIAGAFLFPETRVVVARNEEKPEIASLAVAPKRFGGGGYGITAMGHF